MKMLVPCLLLAFVTSQAFAAKGPKRREILQVQEAVPAAKIKDCKKHATAEAQTYPCMWTLVDGTKRLMNSVKDF